MMAASLTLWLKHHSLIHFVLLKDNSFLTRLMLTTPGVVKKIKVHLTFLDYACISLTSTFML